MSAILGSSVLFIYKTASVNLPTNPRGNLQVTVKYFPSSSNSMRGGRVSENILPKI